MIKALSQALALKREEIQEMILRYRAGKAVKKIREICYLFGADLSHLEDDIIILAIAKLGKTFEGCNSYEAAKLIGHPGAVMVSISELWVKTRCDNTPFIMYARKALSGLDEIEGALALMKVELGLSRTKHPGGRLP
ncbi:MAG: hypothetical protein Q8J63_00755 [Candidatus Aquicultor sp.]|nr:hypothetical protein [Candidatus Aquicultor sp.]